MGYLKLFKSQIRYIDSIILFNIIFLFIYSHDPVTVSAFDIFFSNVKTLFFKLRNVALLSRSFAVIDFCLIVGLRMAAFGI